MQHGFWICPYKSLCRPFSETWHTTCQRNMSYNMSKKHGIRLVNEYSLLCLFLLLAFFRSVLLWCTHASRALCIFTQSMLTAHMLLFVNLSFSAMYAYGMARNLLENKPSLSEAHLPPILRQFACVFPRFILADFFHMLAYTKTVCSPRPTRWGYAFAYAVWYASNFGTRDWSKQGTEIFRSNKTYIIIDTQTHNCLICNELGST